MAFPRVDTQEAARLVRDEGYRILDVRTTAEFRAGHAAGAVHVPLIETDPATGMRRPNTRFLEQVRERFDSDVPLVVMCRSGGRSARAAALLVEAGYREVVDQRAGWAGSRRVGGGVREPGWRDAGLPREPALDE